MIKYSKSNLLIGGGIMSTVVSCSLIIRDDFNNVLLLKKKVKRGQIEKWSLLTQKKRSKEEHEKTIHRGVKDILKSIVFDFHKFPSKYQQHTTSESRYQQQQQRPSNRKT